MSSDSLEYSSSDSLEYSSSYIIGYWSLGRIGYQDKSGFIGFKDSFMKVNN